jgi:hypothetical protein
LPFIQEAKGDVKKYRHYGVYWQQVANEKYKNAKYMDDRSARFGTKAAV